MKAIYFINIGDIIGDFTCIDKIIDDKNRTRNIMKCNICGREKAVLPSTFLQKHARGTTHKSCGQYLKTANKRFHSEWCALRTRTTNPNYEHYDDYGGRGIKSDSWRYFIDFYDDMYKQYLEAINKYPGSIISLERVDVDGDYCKDNCKWIPLEEQKSNMRKTVYFEIEYPDGTTETCRNIRGYALSHNLNPTCLSDLVNGRLRTYKGLKGRRVGKEEYND